MSPTSDISRFDTQSWQLLDAQGLPVRILYLVPHTGSHL